MQFHKQSKGKDSEMVPTKFLESEYYVGLKYDGAYVQIHVEPRSSTVTMFTSSGKEFFDASFAKALLSCLDANLILECEFLGTGEGFLGERRLASTGTMRANFKNNLPNGEVLEEKYAYRIWDVLESATYKYEDYAPYSERVKALATVQEALSAVSDRYDVATYSDIPFTMDEIRDVFEIVTSEHREGLVLTHATHTHKPRRSNLRIKLKLKLEAYGTVIGFVAGKGKYEGKIGSLIIRDDQNLEFAVGSGLTDEQRSSGDTLTNATVHFRYESLNNGIYQQPRIKEITPHDHVNQ